jgi:DMSO/TMAO reductase YedYZ molybdopterin-dependent catalytic subunit
MGRRCGCGSSVSSAKMAKYVMRIELVESLAGIGRGRGGFWEDRGYEWYAGI